MTALGGVSPLALGKGGVFVVGFFLVHWMARNEKLEFEEHEQIAFISDGFLSWACCWTHLARLFGSFSSIPLSGCHSWFLSLYKANIQYIYQGSEYRRRVRISATNLDPAALNSD